MNYYYYELSDAVMKSNPSAFGHKYYVSTRVPYYVHTSFSERIWLEDENGVKLVKDRLTGQVGTQADLKEFMWIKLKCHQI
jgi:hypothetical protein